MLITHTFIFLRFSCFTTLVDCMQFFYIILKLVIRAPKSVEN